MLAFLGVALGLAQVPLPLQIGPINDYGQTLEASERAQLWDYITRLSEEGVQFVYLATWNDPFSDPQRYAAEVFRAWNLTEKHVLCVFVREGSRVWRVVLHPGRGISLPEETDELLARAELEAKRIRPGYAAVKFAERFLSALKRQKIPREAGRPFPWPYVLFGGVLVFLVFFIARRLCPRCGRILRRTESFSGIMFVCPRCRYTRAGRGRRLGGRGSF